MFKKLSIRTKLMFIVAIPIATMIYMAVLAYPTLDTVKINGPEYQKIRAAQDVRADVLPPPLYLVETHSIAADMLTRPDGGDFFLTQGYLKGLQTAYVIQHQVWQKGLRDAKLRKDLLGTSYTPADKYFKVLFNEYLPTLDKAWKAGYTPEGPAGGPGSVEFIRARAVYRDKLVSLYQQHREAILKVVDRSELILDSTENSSSAFVTQRLRVLGLTVSGAILVAGALGYLVARSISRRVRRLTDATTATATVSLPKAVTQIQESDDPSVAIEAPPILTESKDELGELAAAFNGVQSTALSLATDQARIRRVVANNLVNLGRRNQALLTRTLSFISDLEHGERDPRRLDQLFRIDHLVTRMRRNAESLLVLAGSESPQRWSSPVDVGDVVRAAVSEIEAYTRIDITSLEPALVRGSAVNDVAHLLAELLENATSFSPPSSKVTVLGKRRNDGYLIVIVDEGFGMSKEDLERANLRITTPAAFETETSNVLGLQVVGTLSRRQGITVELSESFTSGIAARVLLPVHLMEVAGTAKRLDETAPGTRQTLPPPSPATHAPATTHSPAMHAPVTHTPATQPPAAPQAPTPLPPAPAVPVSAAPHVAPADLPAAPAATLGAAGPGPLWSVPTADDGFADRGGPASWEQLVAGHPAPPGRPLPTTTARPAPPTPTPPAPLPPAPTAAAPALPVSGPVPHAPAAAPPVAPGGLARRVRGAQLPDTGPDASSAAPVQRDPDAVKSSLGRLQQGVESGRQGAE